VRLERTGRIAGVAVLSLLIHGLSYPRRLFWEIASAIMATIARIFSLGHNPTILFNLVPDSTTVSMFMGLDACLVYIRP
jgi:hypothetical protein